MTKKHDRIFTNDAYGLELLVEVAVENDDSIEDGFRSVFLHNRE